jgi:hypothetical protein
MYSQCVLFAFLRNLAAWDYSNKRGTSTFIRIGFCLLKQNSFLLSLGQKAMKKEIKNGEAEGTAGSGDETRHEQGHL